MRILNWMQNKLNGRHGDKKWTVGSSNRHPMQEPIKEEFSDWPHGLLAIGTFGNNQLKEDSEKNGSLEKSNSSQDLSDFTKEEVGKLQKELIKLLVLKPVPNSPELGERETANLPLDKFLNCPSSLDIERTIRQRFCNDLDDEDVEDLSRNTSVIPSKDKEVCMDDKNAIRQKSISFLLKKMFVCRSSFSPTPSLGDSIPESRMEMLLRKILHKKIYPQNTGATSTAKKYLVHKRTAKMKDAENPTDEKESDGCKWVKTDSEFIVLEM
ncbi:protein DEEPER ROOTING 1-like [Magnolia sinica]|uniref:protein DEEPER ROOTING 1-like n=1 Tax=Magnolia sinica TaxID=86752 RepID=UPI002658E5B6|nr:protein DEEPER ROOTING 1-like [Magnolia sinica]XP_058108656.1 protein DEEPER ROOTING 1-like [Magnolia sinica]